MAPSAHSEVIKERKRSRFKCEGHRGGGVVSAGEKEMSESFYGVRLTVG